MARSSCAVSIAAHPGLWQKIFLGKLQVSGKSLFFKLIMLRCLGFPPCFLLEVIMKVRKLVIIGGVAGGASAAAKARRCSEEVEIIMYEKGPDISYANCGLPLSLRSY